MDDLPYQVGGKMGDKSFDYILNRPIPTAVLYGPNPPQEAGGFSLNSARYKISTPDRTPLGILFWLFLLGTLLSLRPMLRRLATTSTARSKRDHAASASNPTLDGSLAMPRQPLKYICPNAKIRMPANPLEEHPELAALVGECIGFWSQVEARLAIMLSAVMKADTGITAAVFLSIRNLRAARGALTAAAKVGLKDREPEMFSAIAIVYQSLDIASAST